MITQPPVKINLGLHILRRRPDGYHDLETLFLPCNTLHDTLEIVPGERHTDTLRTLTERYAPREMAQAISPDGKVMITLARRGGVDWNPLDDLTVKAYQLLAAEADLPPVKIYLEKTSPVGAGLGGGSADAAFALRMLSEQFGLGLDDEALAVRAARIGSDCAFFVYNRPMMGTGRGNILTPFLTPLPFRLAITVPEGIAVRTADAYRGVVPNAQRIPLRDILRQDPSTWRETLVNDFEPSVFARYPQLAALKEALYASGAVYASLSGSGAALFALYRD